MAKRRLSERRRAELLDKFEASGLTAAAFCRAHDLRYQTFLSWRRASAKNSAEAPRFVEVEFAPTEVPPEVLRAELIPHPIAKLTPGDFRRFSTLMSLAGLGVRQIGLTFDARAAEHSSDRPSAPVRSSLVRRRALRSSAPPPATLAR